MSRTLDIPAEVLTALILPELHGLTEDRAAGRMCVWGGELLTIETAVGLGEQLAPNPSTSSAIGERWFPRACHACVDDRARQALLAHAPLCEQCVDEADKCEVGRGLYRLMREARR